MSSLFQATRGRAKLEITNLETGEKFTYIGLITEHQIQLDNRPTYQMANGGSIVDYSSLRSKEITIKFRELRELGKPSKPASIPSNDEEML